MGSCGSFVQTICEGGYDIVITVRAVRNTEISSTAGTDGSLFNPIENAVVPEINIERELLILRGRTILLSAVD